MKGIIISAAVAFLVAGCAGTVMQSKHEARFHAGEKKRVGLLSNDQYIARVKEINASELPDKPSTAIDSKLVRRQYEAKAKGNKAAVVTRAYNSGKVSKDKYNQFLAKARTERYTKVAGALALGLAGFAGASSGASPGFSNGFNNSYNNFNNMYGAGANRASRSGTKYDPKTGNSYSYYTDTLGTTHIRGSNIGTGAMWNSQIDKNGNQRGNDSKMNHWTYNAQTGAYYNLGTGKSCYGKGALRQCY